MPDSATGEEKTEPASPRKRQRSREEGQVAQSKEVASVAVLFGGLLGLYYLSPYIAGRIGEFTVTLMDDVTGLPMSSVEEARSSITFIILQIGLITVPFLLLIGVVSIFGNVIQVGFLSSPKALMPKGERIDPFQGARRVFGVRGLVELLKAIFKTIILGYICWSVIRSDAPGLSGLMDLDVRDTFAFLVQMSMRLAVRCILVLLALSLVDYLYQRHVYEDSIKMTRTEFKQEMKESEGDPLIKARIRQIARERARRRMMQAVPKADVVITNPTHYAVALEYDDKTMPAPKVVAKGKNLIAFKIREIAEAANVPIVQEPPLARAIYDGAEIDDFVPENLYQATAEVLAYVYELEERIKGKKRRLQSAQAKVGDIRSGGVL